MKITTFVFGLIVTLPAIAAPITYRISSQLFIDGKLISSPTIVTLAGEAGEIDQTGNDSDNKLTFKVLPEEYQSDKIKDAILMNFEIEYTYNSRHVKASPQIIAKPGSEASIAIGKSSNKEEVSLKVIATRE